uniref:Metallophos domain-containing protein n=1 Tax=Steinernema glaseri TaxID=37863 RepID=A0A1I7ZZ60_9BILA
MAAPVLVDPETGKPDELWREKYAKQRVCTPVDHPVKKGEPIHEEKVRFVCIADTHEKLESILGRIPDGDVLVHCGDFTNFGDREEIERFNESLELNSLASRIYEGNCPTATRS